MSDHLKTIAIDAAGIAEQSFSAANNQAPVAKTVKVDPEDIIQRMEQERAANRSVKEERAGISRLAIIGAAILVAVFAGFIIAA